MFMSCLNVRMAKDIEVFNLHMGQPKTVVKCYLALIFDVSDLLCMFRVACENRLNSD